MFVLPSERIGHDWYIMKKLSAFFRARRKLAFSHPSQAIDLWKSWGLRERNTQDYQIRTTLFEESFVFGRVPMWHKTKLDWFPSLTSSDPGKSAFITGNMMDSEKSQRRSLKGKYYYSWTAEKCVLWRRKYSRVLL